MIIWLNLFAFGGLEAAFLWVIVLGIYWDKANAAGAISSMVVGLSSYVLLTQFGIKLFGFNAIVPALVFGLVAFILGNQLGAKNSKNGLHFMIYQILALFIWSSAFVAAKYTFTMMDTILMIQTRLFMAAIIVMPLFFRRWKGVSKPMRKQLWWLGFFNYTATFLLQFIGLKYTSAASATTMIGLEPLCVIFIGHFFFQDRAKWYHWLCGAFAFLGVAILILGGHGNEGSSQISYWVVP